MAADTTFAEYHAIAETALAQATGTPLAPLSGGARVESVSGATFDNHSPVDGGRLGTVASGDADDEPRRPILDNGEIDRPLLIMGVDRSGRGDNNRRERSADRDMG